MIHVTPLPAFKDNYFWLIQGNGETWVVDPGDSNVVMEALRKESITKNLINEPFTREPPILDGILITHHHWDHIDGVEALATPEW